MKKPIFFFLLALMYFPVFSQLDPLFSTYQNNILWYNPAFAGSEGKIFHSVTRTQWQVTNNPVTTTLTYDQPLGKLGIGGVLTYDQQANQKDLQAALALNYTIKLNGKSSIKIGASLGVANKQFDYSKYSTIQPDPIFPQPETHLDGAIAVWINSKKFFGGVSLKHVTEPKFGKGTVIYSRLPRHIYCMAGYRLAFGTSFIATPSIIYRYEMNNPTNLIDVSMIAKASRGYIAGIGYRFNSQQSFNANPIIIYAGYDYKDKIKGLLSFDIPMSLLGYVVEWNIIFKIHKNQK